MSSELAGFPEEQVLGECALSTTLPASYKEGAGIGGWIAGAVLDAA